MAPEQARGRPVDRRADIWAFGCVLYEMLTGTRAFDGDDVSATLAYVITKEPDWRALPAGTPIRFRQLLSRCLKKDPKERLQWIGDARIEVAEDLGRAEEPTTAAGTAGGAALSSRWRRLPWWGATTAVVLVTAAYVVVWTRRTPAAPPGTPSLHLETSIGADTPLMPDGASVTMSEDGSSFVFVGGSRIGGQLYLRRLGELRATPLMGTAGSRDPFFSPDGRSIGFFASGKLKKMTLSGGAPVTVCDVESGRGGSWGDDGFIVFANASGGMMRVSAAGGTPEPVTHLGAGEVTHRWPQVLPESKALVYTAHSSTIDFENAVVMIQPLPGGTPVAVQRGGYYGRIFPSGHLVYVHQGALFAVPFDLARLRPAGEPVSVIDGIRATAGLGLTGSAQMAWSTTGTFMYVAGEPAGDLAPVQWLDRTGRVTPLRATPTRWVGLHFSPDGTRLAMGIEKRIWVYEWSRDAPTALTVGAAQGGMPVWSPDGHRIAFASIGDRVPNLYWQRADGSGEVQRLTDSPNQQVPGGFHPSGKFLVFSEQRPQTNDDLMILPIDGDEASGWKAGTPTVFLSTQAVERMPTFSPDGKWIAYTSTESGRGDVFVRPFPMAPGKWLISTAGGMSPVWSPVRSEILYVQEDQLMVVPYTVEGASFKPGQPHPFADGGVRLLRPARHFFALHPDGERVALALVAQESSSLTADKLVIMTNFFDELRRLAPPSKK